ncbi:MAG: hypothetical protein P1V20_03320 [Verrucomicrobiales bacterium]|nr:hypothetical protein [Verrucomicrobiales bacterium]
MSLEDDFPRLKGGHFKITSPQDIDYNCMAWAMEDNSRWWEPGDAGYWPVDIEKEFSASCYTGAFKDREVL